MVVTVVELYERRRWANFSTHTVISSPTPTNNVGANKVSILQVVMGCNQSSAPLPTPIDSIKVAITRNDRLKNIFKLMEESHFDDLINAMTEKKMIKRESLFVRGDKSDEFYVLITGSLAIKNSTSEKEKIFVLSGLNCIGEHGLLEGTARSFSVRAAKKSTLFKALRSDFERVVNNPACYFSKVPLLSIMKDKDRDEIALKAKIIKVQNEETIIAAVTRVEFFYIVLSGDVVINDRHFESTNFFGHEAWLGLGADVGTISSYTATASEVTHLWALGSEAFHSEAFANVRAVLESVWLEEQERTAVKALNSPDSPQSRQRDSAKRSTSLLPHEAQTQAQAPAVSRTSINDSMRDESIGGIADIFAFHPIRLFSAASDSERASQGFPRATDPRETPSAGTGAPPAPLTPTRVVARPARSQTGPPKTFQAPRRALQSEQEPEQRERTDSFEYYFRNIGLSSPTAAMDEDDGIPKSITRNPEGGTSGGSAFVADTSSWAVPGLQWLDPTAWLAVPGSGAGPEEENVVMRRVVRSTESETYTYSAPHQQSKKSTPTPTSKSFKPKSVAGSIPVTVGGGVSPSSRFNDNFNYTDVYQRRR